MSLLIVFFVFLFRIHFCAPWGTEPYVALHLVYLCAPQSSFVPIAFSPRPFETSLLLKRSGIQIDISDCATHWNTSLFHVWKGFAVHWVLNVLGWVAHCGKKVLLRNVVCLGLLSWYRDCCWSFPTFLTSTCTLSSISSSCLRVAYWSLADCRVHLRVGPIQRIFEHVLSLSECCIGACVGQVACDQQETKRWPHLIQWCQERGWNWDAALNNLCL